MEKVKVLVLGRTGMAGHMIYNYLSTIKNLDVEGTTRHDLDARESDLEIENSIIYYNPDVVINCIGIINKYAESDPYDTLIINTAFPNYLHHLSKKLKFRLIHLSSDCVVDDDLYGRSKLLGEVDLTVRTSIIGPELSYKQGLFEWFMSQNEEVNGYKNVWWDGVTTLQLAKFIEFIIKHKKIKGVIEYRTKTVISKYELLRLIAKVYNKKIKVIPDDTLFIDRCAAVSDYMCRKSYMTQLKEMKAWRPSYKG